MGVLENFLAVYGIGIAIAIIIAIVWFIVKIALIITVFHMHDLQKDMYLNQAMIIKQLEILNNQVNNIDKKR